MNVILKDSLVKRIVGEYIADVMFEVTDKDLKAADLPTYKQLVEQVVADEKFQKALANSLAKVINDGDIIHDALEDMPMSAVDAAVRKLRTLQVL